MRHFIVIFLLVYTSYSSLAQQLKLLVKNNVSDQPIPGAVVHADHLTSFKAGATGTISLNLHQGISKLVITAEGFHAKELYAHIPSDTFLIAELQPLVIMTEEVTVAAVRNTELTPMATSSVTKDQINTLNNGQDVPYLLQLLPSVVITSDAGNGIGYSGIRIRGSDPSRINVTINGIPINDAESQQMYWVDLPDFASNTENIQVQRGVGSSTNGAGAFGGTVNLLTDKLSDEASVQTSIAAGSFNTLKSNVLFNSGLLNNHFAFEGRLSKISSDGYIDRGTSDLKSFYLSGGYSDKNNLIRLNIFSGHEVTYQSWNGVPESRYNGDVQGMQEYISRNYLGESDAQNLLQSGRTYNSFTYDNQVDDYTQDHYQLHYARNLPGSLLLTVALHLTHGKGFYEEYKNDESLSDYHISPVITGADTITSSDLIRRKWLDNNFYGTTFSLKRSWTKLEAAIGGGWNEYDGGHYGEVIWSRYAGTSDIRHRYYDNDAVKKDFNIFGKVSYSVTEKLTLFGDFQYRTVQYAFTGIDPSLLETEQNASLEFFNPKGGITYSINDNQLTYVSVAVGHKEPNRDDYVESTVNSRPKAEAMIDYEAGYKYTAKKLKGGVNLFYMDYTDQLILTGAVNDVGNYTRMNIPESYRAGIELEAAYSFTPRFAMDGNLTLSDNRINLFTEYTDAYDADFNYTGQSVKQFDNTPIAFSPAVTAMGRLSIQPVNRLTVQFITRYIDKQYLDNTGNDKRMLQAYNVADLRIEYLLRTKPVKEIRFNLLLNNLLNEKYASNGYTYGYDVAGMRTTENFYFPQATFNVLGQVTMKF